MEVGLSVDGLERRMVARADILYAAPAFAPLEVCDIAFPGLGLPERAVRRQFCDFELAPTSIEDLELAGAEVAR